MKLVSRIVAWCLVCQAGFAAAALPVAVDGQPLPSLAPMLDKVRPAVVNIFTSAEVLVRTRDPIFDDPFFQRFFNIPESGPRRRRRQQGLGSGVIVDAGDGLILTNAHVIAGADEIKVLLHNAKEYAASLVGLDEESDIALLKIEAEKLIEMPIGDSDALRVGDFVVAIGNPFGLTQTVTSGIISGLGRDDLGIEVYEDFIQTDASINPGNSGGALVNLRGELIGVNTAIQSPSGGSVGIGFAIPINLVMDVKQQLATFGEVRRGKLGIQVQDLTPELAAAFNIDGSQGAVVSRIVPNSAADRAGLEEGDVIVGINGRRIDDASDLRNAIGLMRVDSKVDLELLRGGKRKHVVARISQPVIDGSIGEQLNPRLKGATFAEFSGRHWNPHGQGGVFVKDIEPGSTAWESGLRQNDIIMSVNRRAIDDLKSFREYTPKQATLLLNINREGDALFLLIK